MQAEPVHGGLIVNAAFLHGFLGPADQPFARRPGRVGVKKGANLRKAGPIARLAVIHPAQGLGGQGVRGLARQTEGGGPIPLVGGLEGLAVMGPVFMRKQIIGQLRPRTLASRQTQGGGGQGQGPNRRRSDNQHPDRRHWHRPDDFANCTKGPN